MSSQSAIFMGRLHITSGRFRATLSRKERNKHVQIAFLPFLEVMSPDEYAIEVDNSIYTNLVANYAVSTARWALCLAGLGE